GRARYSGRITANASQRRPAHGSARVESPAPTRSGVVSEQHVIIGGGQAAAQAAQTLRQSAPEARIVVVGEEPELPYQRPPLSKKYLAGELPRERLALRPESFYAERRIELELGRRVVAIDRGAQ